MTAAASAAIAMCRCDGIVVVQRMVTAMKWRCQCEPDTSPLHGTYRSVSGDVVCVSSPRCSCVTRTALATDVAVAVVTTQV